MQNKLNLEIKPEKNYTHIILRGALDLYNATELKEKIQLLAKRALSQNLILDIKDAEFIESAFMEGLLRF